MFITFFLILLPSNAMDSVLQTLQTARKTFFENTLRNLATKVDAQRVPVTQTMRCPLMKEILDTF